MIIYPPLINTITPAFADRKLIVYFQHNPAVDIEAVSGMGALLKDYQGTSNIQQLKTSKEFIDLSAGVAIFNLDYNLSDGQYYKIQIYYIDEFSTEDESVEEYALSTASVARYFINTPKAYIKELIQGNLNTNLANYIGVFERPSLSEPSYSHQFIVYDEAGKIIQDSGLVVGNKNTEIVSTIDPNNGTKKIQQELHQFNFAYDIYGTEIYTIKYIVTTVNGYVVTATYNIINKPLFNSYYTGDLEAFQTCDNVENGAITIKLKYNENNLTNGTFVLWRQKQNSNKWERIGDFKMYQDIKANYSWVDYSVVHGETYIYAISQISTGGIQSKKIISNSITVSFEGMFLSDGEKQLKIAFNPKVSSLKETVQESKIETLGSKYPFFFRNSKIGYKEIPISGLISYLQDENNLFMKDEELGLEGDKIRTINLVDYNFRAERLFKFNVMQWLNNGEPKLFRSAAEGNFIVRLMNISLSPDDKLGRMLHTFSATGYEIEECNLDNLRENNLIKLNQIQYEISSKVLTSILDINSEILSEGLEFGTAEAGKKIMVKNKGKIINLIWDNPVPNLEEKISIGGSELLNPNGRLILSDIDTNNFIFSQGDLEGPSQSSFYLNYEYSISPDINTVVDNYSAAADNSQVTLVSIPVNTTIDEVLPSRPIYQIMTVGVYRDDDIKDDDWTEDEKENKYKIKIDDTIIDFSSQEQFRFYDNVQNITAKGKGLHVDLYAQIQKKEVI